MKQILKTLIAGFIAVAMVFTLTPLVGGIAYADDDAFYLDAVVLDGDSLVEEGHAHFYSVDSNDQTLGLDDLNITVLDENGALVDPSQYDLHFERTWYVEGEDGEEGYDERESVELPLGIAEDDQEAGFTEYRVTAEASDGSSYYGDCWADFYIMDRHSLNWICADTDFSPLHDMHGWAMHDYWKGSVSQMQQVQPVVKDCKGETLTKGTDFEIAYFVRGEDDGTGDWSVVFSEENPVLDDDDNPCKPTEPGQYFAKITGNDPYYGEATIVIDLTEKPSIFFDAEKEGYLWSDGTKVFTVDVPDDVEGTFELEAKIEDGEEGQVILSEDDGDFTFDEETGKLTLNGEAIFEKNEDLFEYGVKLYACITDNEGQVLSEGETLVSTSEAEEDNYMQNAKSLSDRELLIGESDAIRCYYDGYIRNSMFPDGLYNDNMYHVTGAEIIEQTPEVEGKEVLGFNLLTKSDEDYGYTFAFYDAANKGTATVRITYENVYTNAVGTHEFTVTVTDSMYEANLWSQNGRYKGLPGDEITLCASSMKKYVEEDAEHPGELQYKESDEGLVFDWSLIQDGALNCTITPDKDDSSIAVLKFSDPEDMPENWDGSEYYVGVKVSVKDKNSNDPDKIRTITTNNFFLSNEFYQIEPTEINANMDVGDSVEVTPKVMHYQTGEEPEKVEGVDFFWEDDVNLIDVQENGDDSYTLTRTGSYCATFCLRAFRADNGEVLAEQWYLLNEKDYSIQLNCDTSTIYNDGNLTVDIDSDSDFEGYDIAVAAGVWDGEEEEFTELFSEGTEYTVDDDERTITLNGKKIYDKVGENGEIRVEAKLKKGDVELYEDWLWFDVREAVVDYEMEEDRNALPGWDGFIANSRHVHAQNTEYPDGKDLEYEITAVTIENQNPEKAGDTVLELTEDDQGMGWDYRAISRGTATLKVEYNDIKGKKQSYTFDINVTSDVYQVDLDYAEGSSERTLPSESVKLIANGRHEAEEQGQSADAFRYEWRLEDGAEEFATVTPDASDPSKATVTFHDIDEEDGFFEEFLVYVDLYDGDDPEIKATADIRIEVSTEYCEIWPTQLENPDPGKTVEVTPELRYYASGEDGYELLSISDYDWSYDEDTLEINEKDGADGTFTIKRLKNWGTDVRLVIDSESLDEPIDTFYWMDGKDYDLHFAQGEYTVYSNDQTNAVIDISELGDWPYELEFEVGSFDEDENWIPADESIYSVSGNEVTIFGNKVHEAELDGVDVHARLLYDDEEITDAWCRVELEITDCNHVWGDPTYTWADDYSTVTATRVCTLDASHQQTETVPATGQITTEATCEQAGVKTYTSSSFSNTAFEVQTTTAEIEKKPHTWNEGTVTQEPTCSSEGEKTVKCQVCGAEDTLPVPKNPDAHVWDEGVETTAPTCGDAGVITYTCTLCQAEKTEAIAATGAHTWADPVQENETPATCTEGGSCDLVVYCSVCGAENPDARETIHTAPLGHDDPLAHTEAKDPTCEADGNLEYWYCSKCGKHFADESGANQYAEDAWIVPAEGHKWDEGVVTKKPDCTNAGERTFKCTVCEETMTQEIPAVGHSWAQKTDPAGFLKNGSSIYECSVCHATKDYTVLPGWASYYVKGLKVKKGKGSITVTWKKQSKKNLKKFNGYQIMYSTKSDMSGAKFKTAGKSSKSKKIGKLKKKTKYYVQVRTYTKSNGVTYYSKWSPKKSVKTK